MNGHLAYWSIGEQEFYTYCRRGGWRDGASGIDEMKENKRKRKTQMKPEMRVWNKVTDQIVERGAPFGHVLSSQPISRLFITRRAVGYVRLLSRRSMAREWQTASG